MSLRSWARSTLHTLNSTLETARAGDRPGRRAAARAARRGLSHRRAHFSEVLEQRLLLTTRMELVAAQADVQRAAADLELAIGVTPEN